MKYISHTLFVFIVLSISIHSFAQVLHQNRKFTRQDTLRGTNGAERSWWDVLHYDISVCPDYKTKTISGKTTIQYKVVKEKQNAYLQIDLQQPLVIDTIFYDGKMYINYPGKPYYQEGNVWHIPLPKSVINSIHSIGIAYHGKPKEAKNPPWDGGWIWKQDEKGRPWMSVACQGLGASVWYPCKDLQSDEPDNGATIQIKVPDSLVAVANGRLIAKEESNNGTTLYKWEIKNPINIYNIVPYIGKYVHWSDNYIGETEKNLSLDYWVLDYELEKAKTQFGRDVKPMLKAFEYWFGAYPFYEDGYKLVQSPHLGMEHQSAVAYGNKFQNGYLGNDLSGSGWGLKWDFIIIHESGHEWFGNNITTNDIADMWVHEGFTNYSETLFTEYYYGKAAGNEYVQGLRKNILNDKPIIGIYGVNQRGSNDMYYKGANLIHTIRQVIDNDSIFRKILRGLNSRYYHKTVDSKDVENFFSKESGIDLSKIFDQYLRTIKIPVFDYKIKGSTFSYRWSNCIEGFNMPISIGTGKNLRLNATTRWQEMDLPLGYKITDINKNFYITTNEIK